MVWGHERLNYLPLLTAVVSFAFFLLIFRQYTQRRRTHQLLWTVAMLLYSVTALMEYLMNPGVMGATPFLFGTYYLLSAPLVGLLGAGVVYLLARRTVAGLFLGFVIVFSVALAAAELLTPLDESALLAGFNGPLASGLMAGSQAYPLTVRIFAIVLNSVGGLILIGGTIYSFLRDTSRTYNVFLAMGGILPAAGGSMLGLLNYPDVFFELELGGTVFLFLGFILSTRYMASTAKSNQKE